MIGGNTPGEFLKKERDWLNQNNILNEKSLNENAMINLTEKMLFTVHL